MDTTLLVALATMGGLGLLFSVFLAIADKKLKVEEDRLVSHIIEILPYANCGACGATGCQDFAVKVVAGKLPVNGCPVGGPQLARDLAQLLGVSATSRVRNVARVLCQGGEGVVVRKKVNLLRGDACSTMAMVAGGDKACYYGCLGSGDCVTVCPSNAIFMGENRLPIVIEELCTGCTLCAKACPRKIIEIHPIGRKMFVFCKNLDDPRTAKSVCAAACTGCGICARKSEGAIRIEDGLAVIDYAKLNEAIIPISQCKTQAIGFLKPSHHLLEKLVETDKEILA